MGREDRAKPVLYSPAPLSEISTMIKHTEMLRHINSGRPCNITVVTYNEREGTGGELLNLEGVRKHLPGLKQTDMERSVNAEAVVDGPVPHRAPHHDAHGTINVRLKDRSIRKVHTRLIVLFNNQEVAL